MVSNTNPELLDEYVAHMHEYIDGGGEKSLKRAYELGREAMAKGIGVLELAALHHEAMTRVMRGAFGTATAAQRIRAAQTYFVESLSPFEMTHRAYRESNEALRLLNERLEEEAKRIAHALHSEASQVLVSAYLALDDIARDLPEDAHHHLHRMRGLLDKASEEIRRLSHELRPTILDDLGLLPALRFLAEGVSARTSTPVVVEGQLDCRLPPAVETVIYRTVQEALTNVTRHAGATTSFVHIVKDRGRVVCSVRDDGAGFDQAAVLNPTGARGIGLLGIRERLHALGGTLQISSAPGRGTDLIVTVPTED